MSRLLYGSLKGYQRAWLRGDLIAGLTLWAVLVPAAPGLRHRSPRVPPVVGLYAAVPALAAVPRHCGSSRHLVVATDRGSTPTLSAGCGRRHSPGAGNGSALRGS